jgi:hypothetical protein
MEQAKKHKRIRAIYKQTRICDCYPGACKHHSELVTDALRIFVKNFGQKVPPVIDSNVSNE